MTKKESGEPTTAIVANITPEGREQQTLVYNSTTESGVIV